MLELLCRLVAKIVFSNINGAVFIVPLIIVLKVLCGQVVETVEIFREV